MNIKAALLTGFIVLYEGMGFGLMIFNDISYNLFIIGLCIAESGPICGLIFLIYFIINEFLK